MGHILVVEDDALLRRVFAAWIGRSGHTSVEVENGQEALRALEGTAFEVVVSDVRMPAPDGLELLRHIKEHWPQTEVILATGDPSTDSAKLAMERGAFAYLAKPVFGPIIQRTVDTAVELVVLRRRLRAVVVPSGDAD